MTRSGDDDPSRSTTEEDGEDTTEHAVSTTIGNNDTATNDNGSTSASAPVDTATRAPSALHNRLLNQQRSNILLQVLFHHMLNSRRRREEEEALALSSPPPLPDREMAVLGHQEALDMNAMCRFCFEGSLLQGEEEGDDAQEETKQSKNNDGIDRKSEGNNTMSERTSTNTSATRTTHKNALIAPCNCAGGSRWVHLACLRQWQRMQARSLSSSSSDLNHDDDANPTTTTMYTAAGYICNVCNSPYLSRPPVVRGVRRNLLRRGTLLVSRSNAGRTFQQTVVLLLSSNVCGNPHGAFGVIVNAPLQEEAAPVGLFLPPPPQQTPQDQSQEHSGEQQQDHGGESHNLVADNGNDQHAEEHGDDTTSNNNDSTISANMSSSSIEWRRGGPVCGGRLGVVHYTILHTYPPTLSDVHQGGILDVDIDEEYIDDDNDGDQGENDPVDDAEIGDATSAGDNDVEASLADTDDADSHISEDNDEGDEEHSGDLPDNDDTCGPLSLPVFDVARNTPPLQFLASTTTPLPSTFSEDKLERIVRQLTGHNQITTTSISDTSDEPAANTDATETEDDNQDNNDGGDDDSNNNKVIIFSGYCKWRAGQLEREIQREVWDVCVDATPADIFRHHGSGFWEEIRESDRLLSWQRLVEEEEVVELDDNE